MIKIRKRKDGGFSECSSPDEKVGKGRCCHVLDINNANDNLELSKISNGMYEVKINNDILKINSDKNVIINFFNTLPKLNEEKQKKIIDFLSEGSV